MKRIVRQLRSMSVPTAMILTAGLCLCDALLLLAAVTLLRAGSYTIQTYQSYILASALEKTELGVLYVTVFVSAFVEEQIRKRA